MSVIDAELTARAAAPGSMRYFAWLYTPPEERDRLVALLTIEQEIIGSATQVAHEVAHTRLGWWREDISRLGRGQAQHPALRLIQGLQSPDTTPLGELLVAAQMDLARVAYDSVGELDAYFERRTAFWQLLMHGASAGREVARRLGRFIRRVETLRDTRVDAVGGRVYWPLDELDRRQVRVEDLRELRTTDATRQLIKSRVIDLNSEWEKLRTSKTARGLFVLAALHARLLRHFERANYDVLSHRHELGSMEKIWSAWRAARHASR